MADYFIWGSVEEIHPGQFPAIACAVRKDDPGAIRANTSMQATRHDAEQVLSEMVRSMGQMVIEQGHRVTDVETDGI